LQGSPSHVAAAGVSPTVSVPVPAGVPSVCLAGNILLSLPLLSINLGLPTLKGEQTKRLELLP
jgi:hypothetical protein